MTSLSGQEEVRTPAPGRSVVRCRDAAGHQLPSALALLACAAWPAGLRVPDPVAAFNSPAGDHSTRLATAQPAASTDRGSCPCTDGIPEGEPDCGLPGDSTNGGCNATPPRFTPIRPGEAICGTAAFDGQRRDTDWYALTTGVAGRVTWTVRAEFDVQILILAPGAGGTCPAQTLATAQARACETAIASTCRPAGPTWLFVAPQLREPVPCDQSDHYRAVVSFIPGPCDPRPANDDCANAQPVGGAVTPFSTLGATTDGPDEPELCSFFGDPAIQADVWFCYTADCTADVEVDTCVDTTFNTELAVYPACTPCPSVPGTVLACNDDACGAQSLVRFAAVSGRRYLIRVGGFQGATGTGNLRIRCQLPCPDLSCPGGAVPEPEPCGSSANDGCSATPPAFTPLLCPAAVCGTTWAADGLRDSDWYRFPVDVDQTVVWRTVTEDVPLVFRLLSDSCPGQTLAAGDAPRCGNGQLSARLDPGTYRVWIAPGSLSAGIFDGHPCGPHNDYVAELLCSQRPACNQCPHAPTCPGDADGDRCVAQPDLGVLLSAFGTGIGQPGYTGCADFDCDGRIDQADLGALLARFGQCCPGSSGPCPAGACR